MRRRILATAYQFGLGLVALARVIASNPIFSITLKYGVGLALLAWVIAKYWEPPPGMTTGGLVNVWKGEVPVQWLPLGAGGLICLVSILLTFVRWYVLVRGQGLAITLPHALRLGLLGFFWSTFFPGSVGGDAVKAFYIAREQSRRTVAVSTVLVDRLVGLWGLVWLVALLGGVFWALQSPILLASPYLRSIVFSAAGIVGGTLVAWFLAGFFPDPLAQRIADRLDRMGKVGHSVAELWRSVWLYHREPRAVTLSLLMSIVGHVGFVLTFYFSAQVFLAADQHDRIPSLEEHFLIVPIGMTWQAIFPTPGGVGGAELGFAELYRMVDKLPIYGVLGCLAQRVIMWVLALSGYLFYLWTKPAVRVEEEEPLGELTPAKATG